MKRRQLDVRLRVLGCLSLYILPRIVILRSSADSELLLPVVRGHLGADLIVKNRLLLRALNVRILESISA